MSGSLRLDILRFERDGSSPCLMRAKGTNHAMALPRSARCEMTPPFEFTGKGSACTARRFEREPRTSDGGVRKRKGHLVRFPSEGSLDFRLSKRGGRCCHYFSVSQRQTATRCRRRYLLHSAQSRSLITRVSPDVQTIRYGSVCPAKPSCPAASNGHQGSSLAMFFASERPRWCAPSSGRLTI